MHDLPGPVTAGSPSCARAGLCARCRTAGSYGDVVRAFVLRKFLPDRAELTDCPFGRGAIIVNAAELGPLVLTSVPPAALKDEDYAQCDECQYQDWPSGSARGCKLIESGKPCALANRIRANGPWPDVCPRKKG